MNVRDGAALRVVVDVLGGTIEAVRDLHWVDEAAAGDEPVCSECRMVDCDDEVPAPWPCSTAELVYSPAEVADVLAAWRSWRRWGAARAYRARMARGWVEPLFPSSMSRRLLELTRQRFIADVVLRPGEPVKIAGAVTVSYEQLAGNGPDPRVAGR